MSRYLPVVLAAGLFTGLALPALAEGDPAKGEKVFKKCMACHSVAADAGSKIGPNLHDVVGRTTASLEGFKYSPAMQKLGEEGHVWTPEELNKFLENPKTLVPGTKMTFAGLKKPDERDDVVAYLVSLHPDGVAAQGAEPPAAAPAEAAPSN